MKVIGLTGGISCGKSVCSRHILDNYPNVYIVDADLIARSGLDPGNKPYKTVVDYFEKTYRDPVTQKHIDVLNQDGTVNRPLLGKLVFEHQHVRRMINKATHGYILKEMLSSILKHWRIKDLFSSSDSEPIVIVDAPLLYETYWFSLLCSKIIVVETSEENQLKWLTERNNLTQEDAQNRVNSQMPLIKKIEKADYVISNRNSIEHFKQEADRVFQKAVKESRTFNIVFAIICSILLFFVKLF
ncbi:dephospho-CoA kinase [Acrasis kona]|uniref:Dephospho-CoA kinase n=1 Tax=Acrasis kona TaxID=1008807 RepID=A0AAW2YPC0_9EUKA